MFGNRKQRLLFKNARELLRGARKMVRIQCDLMTPEQVERAKRVCQKLADALASKDPRAVESAVREVETTIDRNVPAARRSSLRENVEVFLVAAIVAMAVRTFVLQPFKIPTGSMQPTLYGIHDEPRPDGPPNILMRAVDLVLFGTIHRAGSANVRGDHIFVDKVSYHFRKPRRGEVIVFETKNITEMPPSALGQFYIKRLIGVGGDVVQIDPPHVKIDGQILDSRHAFERIYSMTDGYNGFVCQPPGSGRPKYLYHPDQKFVVPRKHLFVLGDNTLSSSDGRYWGSVPQENLVGRAILVYWPLSKRFGRLD